jgi:hypothetical protein
MPEDAWKVRISALDRRLCPGARVLPLHSFADSFGCLKIGNLINQSEQEVFAILFCHRAKVNFGIILKC